MISAVVCGTYMRYVSDIITLDCIPINVPYTQHIQRQDAQLHGDDDEFAQQYRMNDALQLERTVHEVPMVANASVHQTIDAVRIVPRKCRRWCFGMFAGFDVACVGVQRQITQIVQAFNAERKCVCIDVQLQLK